MRYVLLLLLLLGFGLSGRAQGHTNKLGCRLYHIANNVSRGYRAEGMPLCPACYQRDQEEEKKRLAKLEQETKDILARIEKDKADRQSERQQQLVAEAKERADRRAAALSNLAAAEANAREFERLNQADQERRAAVRRKFQQQEEQANQAYSDYLRQLQDANNATASAAPDDFWNETVPMTNYEPVQAPQGSLWGFRNKQQKMVIDFKYNVATPFHQGAALVLYADRAKNTYNYQLINARGEVTREFDKSYFESISTPDTKITSLMLESTNGKAFSEGLLVVEFSKQPHDANTRIGCIDPKGNVVIAPSFYYIKPFRNGVAEAARFEDEEKYSFKDEYPGTYEASFTYLQVGLIDRSGKWVTEPKKKMAYSYYLWGENMYLIVESANAPRLSDEEKKARKAAADVEKAKARAVSMAKLEAEVQRRVDAAKARGYLTEGAKRN